MRRSIKGGAKEVTQRHLIGSYNKGMDGVDLMDRLLNHISQLHVEKMVHVEKMIKS